MARDIDPIERDRQLLAAAEKAGGMQKYKAFVKLSGPGWIASAITLGGGSLASSLYLGVLAGYSLLWLQPFAMILGVVMLSAIGYVTLSTGERPFPAINEHVSPVLGWGWALAVAAANVIWCMPQNALAYGVLSQNLLPEAWFGETGSLAAWATARLGDTAPWWAANFDKFLVAGVILAFAAIITWSYDRGGLGLRLYEAVLKIMVAIIVLCFFGVVVQLTFSDSTLSWSKVLAGLVPDFGQFFRPAPTWNGLLEKVAEVGSPTRIYWTDAIVAAQRDVMISAAATAVGINMTLMFPYSMLRKGWTREFRSLAVFDLSTGMFIPYVLATGCVVLAAAAQFHTQVPDGFRISENGTLEIVDLQGPKYGEFQTAIAARDTALQDAAAGPANDAEQQIAAMLIPRDAMDLSNSLEPLTGKVVADFVFGLGVLAMVLSTISILMLISGFVFSEMMACPPGGLVHKLGTLVAGVGGALWPLLWAGQSKFYLAVVTSVVGFMLLPFAYVTFVFLMNSKSLLGAELPRGGRRVVWNVLTLASALIVTAAAAYMIRDKAGGFGIAVLIGFAGLALLVAINQRNTNRAAARNDPPR
jgi:Mn2+/Fe2+ NRAMP family transporter